MQCLLFTFNIHMKCSPYLSQQSAESIQQPVYPSLPQCLSFVYLYPLFFEAKAQLGLIGWMAKSYFMLVTHIYTYTHTNTIIRSLAATG